MKSLQSIKIYPVKNYVYNIKLNTKKVNTFCLYTPKKKSSVNALSVCLHMLCLPLHLFLYLFLLSLFLLSNLTVTDKIQNKSDVRILIYKAKPHY